MLDFVDVEDDVAGLDVRDLVAFGFEDDLVSGSKDVVSCSSNRK